MRVVKEHWQQTAVDAVSAQARLSTGDSAMQAASDTIAQARRRAEQAMAERRVEEQRLQEARKKEQVLQKVHMHSRVHIYSLHIVEVL